MKLSLTPEEIDDIVKKHLQECKPWNGSFVEEGAKALLTKIRNSPKLEEEIYKILAGLRQELECEDDDFHYDAILKAQARILALFGEAEDE